MPKIYEVKVIHILSSWSCNRSEMWDFRMWKK